MDRNDVSALLKTCEARLAEGRRSLDDVAAMLAQVSAALEGSAIPAGPASPIQEVLASHRDEIVSQVVAALQSTTKAATARDSYTPVLVHRAEDDSYRLGRRQLSLTDTERLVLGLLWSAMPEPVSRQAIHDALYAGVHKPAAGTIDVFVSKLRQKLKLASGGTEFFESMRGRGWALKPELCRHGRTAEAGDAGHQRA